MTTSPFLIELLGWAAALLTLLTFACHDMRRLRLLALAANAAFIAYGALAELLPVLALHMALVPVNLRRLAQTLRPAPPRCTDACVTTLPERVAVGACWQGASRTHGRSGSAGIRRTLRKRRAATHPIRTGLAFACADTPAIRP
ncbi:MAG: hypothetical protein JNJ71_19840 [Rubrivivax sp.]|nr:hypothetical protein [Rubrivivax sp.]